MKEFKMSMYTNKEDLYKAKSDYLEAELAKHKNFARWCIDMADSHGGADYCRVRSQVRMANLEK